MSRLIETMRFAEGRVQNFDYHLRRMDDASMAHFGDTLHWKPRYLIDTIELPSSEVHKVRLVYDFNKGTITTEPYTIRPVRSLKLVFDDNIGYSFKYEDRSAIDRLVQLKENCDDILIIKNNLVTDVSYANIAFKKDNTWYTPDSFLLNGIMRQKLLDTNKIKERRIGVDDIKEFTHFKLINALLLDEAPESEVLNIR
jgi:4-amino-4-deoxychorismate lyase